MPPVIQTIAEPAPHEMPSVRDAMVHVFYNLKMILFCLVLGLAMGVAAAVASLPKFTAESLVLLRIGATEAAQEGLNGPPSYLGGEAVQRTLQSDVQIVRSDPVIRAAMLDMTPGVAIESRAMARFAKALKVEIEPGSNVMRIAFADEDRGRALRAVQAVVDAYVARRSDLYVNASRARQDQEIERYDRVLNRNEAEIQTTRRDHDVLDIDKDMALASDRLDALSQRAAQAGERRAVVMAELAAVNRTMTATPERVADSQERTNSTPNDEARNTLLRLRQDRAHLVEQYTEDWPGLVEVDARIAAAQAQIIENSQDIRSSDRTVRNPVADLLATRRASLGIELASLGRQSVELAGQLATARARVGELRGAEMRLHDLERSRSASETIHRSLLIGRAGASLEDQAVDDRTTTVRIVQPPTAPRTGRDLRPALLLGGIALGLALAIAATAVSVALRQVFIAPEEARTVLGAEALITFDMGASDMRSKAGQATVDRLASLLLDVAIDGRALRVVQIVGDDAAAKSRLGLALAQAIAARTVGSAASGGPVLLIDFDAAGHYRRKAAAAAIRTLPAGAGRLEVARSVVPGLWAALAPSETALGDPRATINEARAALDIMRGAFGRVVLVAGREFDGYGARRLYGMADASLLLIQAGTTRAPTAKRMREVVLASGGDLLGFVFTGRKHYIPEAIYRWL